MQEDVDYKTDCKQKPGNRNLKPKLSTTDLKSN